MDGLQLQVRTPKTVAILVDGRVRALQTTRPTVRGRSRWQIWLRGPDRAALRKVARQAMTVEKESKIRVTLDVDPNSAL